jgi:hypothetical protein
MGIVRFCQPRPCPICGGYGQASAARGCAALASSPRTACGPTVPANGGSTQREQWHARVRRAAGPAAPSAPLLRFLARLLVEDHLAASPNPEPAEENHAKF